MRVLITGLNGFTGKYLGNKLKSLGCEIFDLNANLCDSNAVNEQVKKINPEMVAHLAAVSFVGHQDINEIYNVNLLGSQHLLSALAQHAPQVKSILLASTANIYGNNSNNGLIDESTLPRPTNDYAVSKLSMEYMSQLWQDKLPIFIVRPFNYTGIGQHQRFIIPKIVAHFAERRSVIQLGNIEIFREFNDVRFIADVYSQLLFKAPVGACLNICTGRAYSLSNVIDSCIKLTNHQLVIKINPAFIRQNEVTKLVGCNVKLSKSLRTWEKYTLEDTLEKMLMI